MGRGALPEIAFSLQTTTLYGGATRAADRNGGLRYWRVGALSTRHATSRIPARFTGRASAPWTRRDARSLASSGPAARARCRRRRDSRPPWSCRRAPTPRRPGQRPGRRDGEERQGRGRALHGAAMDPAAARAERHVVRGVAPERLRLQDGVAAQGPGGEQADHGEVRCAVEVISTWPDDHSVTV